MAKIFSARYNAGAVNTGLFILRVGMGLMLAHHGYQKLVHFDTMKTQMINFLNIGQSGTLYLVIFAELVCSLMVVFGLLTRLALIPIIILCIVILMKAVTWDFFGKGEMITLYLIAFVALLFTGPGKASVDGMMRK